MKVSDILNTPEKLSGVVASATKTGEMTSKADIGNFKYETDLIDPPCICEWA